MISESSRVQRILNQQNAEIIALRSKVDRLEKDMKRNADLAEYYRKALHQIVQMERFPTESGSHVYDGIYPTGRFAVKVLKGEWKND